MIFQSQGGDLLLDETKSKSSSKKVTIYVVLGLLTTLIASIALLYQDNSLTTSFSQPVADSSFSNANQLFAPPSWGKGEFIDYINQCLGNADSAANGQINYRDYWSTTIQSCIFNKFKNESNPHLPIAEYPTTWGKQDYIDYTWDCYGYGDYMASNKGYWQGSAWNPSVSDCLSQYGPTNTDQQNQLRNLYQIQADVLIKVCVMVHNPKTSFMKSEVSSSKYYTQWQLYESNCFLIASVNNFLSQSSGFQNIQLSQNNLKNAYKAFFSVGFEISTFGSNKIGISKAVDDKSDPQHVNNNIGPHYNGYDLIQLNSNSLNFFASIKNTGGKFNIGYIFIYKETPLFLVQQIISIVSIIAKQMVADTTSTSTTIQNRAIDIIKKYSSGLTRYQCIILDQAKFWRLTQSFIIEFLINIGQNANSVSVIIEPKSLPSNLDLAALTPLNSKKITIYPVFFISPVYPTSNSIHLNDRTKDTSILMLLAHELTHAIMGVDDPFDPFDLETDLNKRRRVYGKYTSNICDVIGYSIQEYYYYNKDLFPNVPKF
ncbi:UNKNOWN [Stylonychia lemnae]|uniref:Uncharacterized protein n=1 Tax=Stylonychia lemnae TaxID=5949 RepID=A0A077ZVG0_STYLE|nr:UNKNOWN [Stylonychia lemnae]|eukprot:CDW72411.1 UNKNOWN [Stylonychia lemnae]